ncbi:hypothetical protein Thi970DRAFT_01273 [Thiorhodovibrio frisius]|uniref:Uncharacterized protein n=2 Tax=Thiorhodovibrio frisius TaxID=631362 RepID=H8YYS5_9GAMM|nr:hypothetical protein [Thiorhodovibrio frisius]EIC23601.1 hypothetical protein Thi970DRAFT_01273 [Thiorhodovibrio frisius]WPL23312.1 hypothetical protein Thiofri_03497 [Thiorhodovibrio frisius]
MARAEQEGVPFLFKLRMSKGVKQSIERLMRDAHWCDAGQGWEGAETPLRLQGWGRHRRAIVLRRRIKGDLAVVDQSDPDQLQLSFAELTEETVVYEYAVLITSLTNEILSVAQLYRDRADVASAVFRLRYPAAPPIALFVQKSQSSISRNCLCSCFSICGVI